MLGSIWRQRLAWTAPVEDWVIEAGEDVRLLVRASWQPGRREAHPAVVIVHGLGGSDQAGYSLSTGLLAFGLGWHVLRMNLRGAGDSEAICPRLYNAGLDTDLLAVLEAAGRVSPRVAVVGFSLGANLALLTAARQFSRLPKSLFGLVAVSPPLDLAACAASLERPGNRFYQTYFMRRLKAGYRRRQQRRPDLYAPGRERGTRTIRDYDEAITAPYGGHASAAAYYASSSAGPRLVVLDRPTLILAATDDPMIPPDSVSRWPLPASGLVRREMLGTGGHVGFVAPSEAPGAFWAGAAALRFLGALIPGDDVGRPERGLS